MTAQRDITAFVRSLERGIKASIRSAVLKDIGKQARNVIVDRTRRGFSVKMTGDNKRIMKPLRQSTILRRQRKRLAATTSPSTSNLTESGQMLRSIGSSVKSGVITISPRRTRRDGKTNQQVANFVSGERPFLNLSRSEFEAVAESFDEALDKSLRESLSRLRR